MHLSRQFEKVQFLFISKMYTIKMIFMISYSFINFINCCRFRSCCVSLSSSPSIRNWSTVVFGLIGLVSTTVALKSQLQLNKLINRSNIFHRNQQESMNRKIHSQYIALPAVGTIIINFAWHVSIGDIFVVSAETKIQWFSIRQ